MTAITSARQWSRHMATEVEYWPTFDPTAIEGDRGRRLEAYREVLWLPENRSTE